MTESAVGNYHSDMKVVELTDVSRRETPLYYRRAFTATAMLEHGSARPMAKKVEFVLEHSPLGPINITVKMLDDLDYPLLPAIQAIKEHVQDLELSGRLP